MRAISWFILALLISNLTTAYFVKKYSINPYRDMSNAMLSMSRPGGPFVAILGDSLANNAHFPSQICGYRTVNMSIDGAKASTFIQYAEQMSFGNLHPSLVVIALGVNDAIQAGRSDFKESLELLLRNLPQSPLALTTVFQNIPSKDAINNEIRKAANRRGAILIETENLGISTSDGVHPAHASQPTWENAIVSGIKRGLGCADKSGAPSPHLKRPVG
jgi:GDSL-like lipase/acylhydrolase family protein